MWVERRKFTRTGPGEMPERPIGRDYQSLGCRKHPMGSNPILSASDTERPPRLISSGADSRPRPKPWVPQAIATMKPYSGVDNYLLTREWTLGQPSPCDLAHEPVHALGVCELPAAVAEVELGEVAVEVFFGDVVERSVKA